MGVLQRLGLRKQAGGRKVTTPDGLPAVVFPSNYQRLLALHGIAGTLGAIYRTQPNVRSVVDFFADEVAGIRLKVYEKVPSSPLLPTGRIELDRDPLQRILNYPSPRSTRSRLWRETIRDVMIYDIAFWMKVRIGPAVRALHRIPPAALMPERDPVSHRLIGYKTAAGEIITPEQLVVFPGYHPETNDGTTSPLETLRRILAEEQAAGSHREYAWRNAARKDGVVTRPAEAPPWTDEQREAWRTDWEAFTAGDFNSGRTALLEDGMTWTEATWSPKQMEYLGARQLTRKETAAAFRIDPRLVFASDDAITQAIRTAFYVDRLIPFLESLEEEIDLQLLPDFEPLIEPGRVYTEFNIDSKMRGSFTEEAQIMSSAVGGPWLTVNEARARRNLPPVADGDQIFVPLNSVRGGGPQASPRAPIDTPSELPAPGETPGDGTQRGEASRKADGRKALVRGSELEELRDLAASARARLLTGFFERQRQSVKSAGSKQPLTKAFDSERWDRELGADLAAAAVSNAALFGGLIAGRIGGSYDVERTAEYWGIAMRAAAEAINRATRLDLATIDDADKVFETATSRVESIARAQVNREAGWGAQEAMQQNERAEGTKTWIVTSKRPRASHAAIGGESVPLFEAFGNGMQYPGDPAGGADEVAGCTCVMDLDIP